MNQWSVLYMAGYKLMWIITLYKGDENYLQCHKQSPYMARGAFFYICLYIKKGEKWSSQCWPRPFYSQPRQPPCLEYAHPPPPIPPFLLVQNLSSIAPTDNVQPKSDDAKRHHRWLKVRGLTSICRGLEPWLLQGHKWVGVVVTNLHRMAASSLVPRPPPFLPSVCVHNNTRERKTSEKRGRPGSIHHVNDVRWTRGGHRGGGADSMH